MNEAQIKHMVNRFLNWKLPEGFNPDGGVILDKAYIQSLPASYPGPSGTNLLDAMQADAMVRHMLDGLPLAAMNEEMVRGVKGLLDVYAPETFNLEMAATVTSCAISGMRLPDEKLPKVSVGYRTDDSDRVPADLEQGERDDEAAPRL